jgi:translation initiation factor 2A
VKIIAVKDWSTVQEIVRPRVLYLKFSPKGTFLMTWEPFMSKIFFKHIREEKLHRTFYSTATPENPQGTPNMNVFKTQDGQLLKGYVFKKHSGW